MSAPAAPRGYDLEKLLRGAFNSGDKNRMEAVLELTKLPQAFEGMSDLDTAFAEDLAGEMAKFLWMKGYA